MPQRAQNTTRLASATDRAVIELLDRLVKSFPPSHLNLTAGNENLGQFNNADAFAEQFPLNEWEDTRIITSASATLLSGKIQVHFQRYVTEFGNPDQRIPSAWENEVWVDRSGNPAPSPAESLKVMRVVDTFRADISGTAGITTPRDDLLDVTKRQVAELTTLHNKIVRDAEEARKTADKEFDARRSRLEKEWEERRRKLDAEHDVKRQQNLDEENRLKERQKELDDRGHMHARRDLRAEITKALKERLHRPGVSAQTTLLRIAFSFLALVAALGFSFAAWQGGLEFSRAYNGVVQNQELGAAMDNVAFLVLALRFAIPAAIAAALLFYLLNWLRRIHTEDVRAERELERYRYDIDRASWAAETILEASGKEGWKVPDEWIHGATHNLFARVETKDEDHSALGAVAALLGLSARAEIGTSGAKIELNKGGLRRLGRTLDGE